MNDDGHGFSLLGPRYLTGLAVDGQNEPAATSSLTMLTQAQPLPCAQSQAAVTDRQRQGTAEK